jgi:catechol 2,3-dioxygenase-like lactoylglutathione lyase family enzyme
VISGVDFVCVPTADFERAAAFYGGVLGLECTNRYDRIPGGEFEAGNLTLQVIDAAAVGMEMRASGTPIALHVDDFAGAHAELESRGVSFDADTINSGVCLMAPFRDPDGNRLLLHHRYAPRA